MKDQDYFGFIFFLSFQGSIVKFKVFQGFSRFSRFDGQIQGFSRFFKVADTLNIYTYSCIDQTRLLQVLCGVNKKIVYKLVDTIC